MQTLTTTDVADIDELQKLIDEAKTPREKATKEFIIQGFKGKTRSLTPFALENESVQNLASYLLKYTKSKSKGTLYQYVYAVYRFCRWIGKSPDNIIGEVKSNEKTIDDYIRAIDSFNGDLQAEDLASGTINNYVKGVTRLFKTNGLPLALPYRIPKYVKYSDRAPTSEELSRIIEIAPIKGKTVVSMLALGGMRLGTLVKLTYRHVKTDLEAGVVPVHIHVEADITKGKYGAYNTFLGSEAVRYLKEYLDMRKAGTEKLPPEVLTDTSPLIRNECRNTVLPVSEAGISTLVHRLLFKAGIIVKGEAKRYPVRPHSVRKYFKTQLEHLRIPTEYIEYMMGHSISTYHSIDVEYLRNLYASSGLSIRPKTEFSKLERLIMFAESLGLDPNEVFTKDALAKPHRTVVDSEARKIEVLNEALKHAILKELRNA